MNDVTLAAAACRDMPTAWWYPTREPGTSNHAGRARSVCKACPVRSACMVTALARREAHGIWGGAGESRRRVLLRAMAAGRLDEVAAAHWRQLDGVSDPGDRALLVDSGNGTHGRRSTQARGCTDGPDGTACEACVMAAAFDGAVSRMEPKRHRRDEAA